MAACMLTCYCSFAHSHESEIWTGHVHNVNFELIQLPADFNNNVPIAPLMARLLLKSQNLYCKIALFVTFRTSGALIQPEGHDMVVQGHAYVNVA